MIVMWSVVLGLLVLLLFRPALQGRWDRRVTRQRELWASDEQWIAELHKMNMGEQRARWRHHD